MKRFTSVFEKDGKQFLVFIDEMNPLDDLEPGLVTLRFVTYVDGKQMTISLAVERPTSEDGWFPNLSEDESRAMATNIEDLFENNTLTELFRNIKQS